MLPRTIACALALCAGCAGAEVTHLERGLSDGDIVVPPELWERTIVGGGPELGEPATALLMAYDENQTVFSLCSGTLIAPLRVVTAAHCIDDEIAAAGYRIYFGTDVSGPDPGFIFMTEATEVVIHPAWDRTDLYGGNDIGLVFLGEAPPITPIPPRTQPLDDDDLDAPIKLVGWGITAGDSSNGGVKRSAASTLIDINGNLIVVGDQSTGTCNGDSGGPAFMDGGSGVELIGITSFGDLDCDQISVDTRVDMFAQFIASDGQVAGGTAGFGAACTADADCVSGTCAFGQGGGGFCTQSCIEDAGCPSGFVCADSTPESGQCIAQGASGVPGQPGTGGSPDASGGIPNFLACSSTGSTGGSALILLIAAAFGLRRRRR